ncbi:sulfatase [Aquimarina aggregata]|nr:sulfatase [Aquimarina aggregata]
MFIKYSVIGILWLLVLTKLQSQSKPNILFIPVDDLNHWVEFIKRNDQVKTPNLNRLVKRGVSFTKAYSPGTSCSPSRTAIMSGMRPSTSGSYKNKDNWKDYVKEGTALNHILKNNGYNTYATGKIYHNQNGDYPSGWTENYRAKVKKHSSPNSKFKSKDRKSEGYSTIVKTTVTDTDISDWYMVDYCKEKLMQKHDKPFFLACGFIKPHLPWIVPQKYYDMYPLEDIKIPPYLKNDLDDIPPTGKRIGYGVNEHKKIVENNNWKIAVQSYMATISYMDMNLGRLLDAVEESPYKDNLVIVLFGDHGWHLGEKSHWRKFTLWEEGSHTPLIWSIPGVTPKNKLCDKPVDLMSLFPTICELAKISRPSYVEGTNIMPLLKNPNTLWDKVAITTHDLNKHAIRSEHWRYIKYSNNSEELYNHKNDPYEFENIAALPEMKFVKEKLKSYLPKTNTPSLPESKTTKRHK